VRTTTNSDSYVLINDYDAAMRISALAKLVSVISASLLIEVLVYAALGFSGQGWLLLLVGVLMTLAVGGIVTRVAGAVTRGGPTATILGYTLALVISAAGLVFGQILYTSLGGRP
jgi:hypothetical protein